jgi:aspartyl/asparaginyl beta-hydroxylase (cupin superfamily)
MLTPLKKSAVADVFYYIHEKTPIFDICNGLFLYYTVSSIVTLEIPNIYKCILILLLYLYVKHSIVAIISVWNNVLEFTCNNPPMHVDKNLFPTSRILEKNFNTIRFDIEDLVKNHQLPCIDQTVNSADKISTLNETNCWRFHFIKLAGKFDKLLDTYPKLKEFLNDPQIDNATISILEPNVSIPEHYGYFKGYLRYHLCIETSDNDPNKPYIICGGEKYTWATGEGVLFDDMYLHKVVNNSSKRRIVLYLDVKRKNLIEPLSSINEMLCKWVSENIFLNIFVQQQHVQKKTHN